MYSYRAPSEFRADGGQRELALATSGGVTEAGPAVHPRFFSGLLTEPAVAAAGMLAVAAVARARYVTSASVVAQLLRDPVVTSNGDRLRFESFSSCCGVYSRLDLLPGALDGAMLGTGTTNVDFGPAIRGALAQVAGLDPMHLSVGLADAAAVKGRSRLAEEARRLQALM